MVARTKKTKPLEGEVITRPEGKSGPRQRFLDPNVLAVILACISSGTWDYVAAEAAGIPQQTFIQWLSQGRKDNAEADKAGILPEARTEYAQLDTLVMRARATARASMEMAVAVLDPKSWLEKGPGREREGRPGWGTSVAHVGDQGGPMRYTFSVERASGGIEVGEGTEERSG